MQAVDNINAEYIFSPAYLFTLETRLSTLCSEVFVVVPAPDLQGGRVDRSEHLCSPATSEPSVDGGDAGPDDCKNTLKYGPTIAEHVSGAPH